MSGSIEHPSPWPEVDFASFGEVEAKPLGRIQQLTARHLARNWTAIPHVTHHDEADVTDLEVRRTAWNAARPQEKITLLIPLIRATVAALQAFPVFNTSLGGDGRTLFWKKYIHIGIAVDTPRGLLVPVIRDCSQKSSRELAEEIESVTARARSKGLSMEEMSGGCFTITSLGHIGGVAFTPIVNAPETAILGVSRLQKRPRRADHDALEWRDMLPISLSYDHRVINGAEAARFARHIAEELADQRFC